MPIEQPWNGRVKVGNRLRIDMFGSVFGSNRPSKQELLEKYTQEELLTSSNSYLRELGGANGKL